MFDRLPGGIGLGSVPSEYRRRGYRHTVSWVFYGIFFAIVAGQGPFVIRTLGGSALQCLMIDLGLAVPLIFSFLWGPLVRRRNPVRFTSLTLIMGGVLVLFSGMAPGFWFLSLVLTGGMFLLTLSRPMIGVVLRQIYPDQWRGKLMGLSNASSLFGRVLTLAVTGFLLRRNLDLYRWVFPVAGLALLIGGFLFRGIRGSRGEHAADDEAGTQGILAQAWESARIGLGNRGLVMFLLGYTVTTFGSVSALKALPIFASDDLQLNPEQYGLALAACQLTMAVSLYPWGVLMDRIGAPLTAVASWVLQFGVFFALFFVKSWPLFFVLVAGRGLFQAANLIAFYPIVMHFTKPSETQHGMSLHFTMWGLRWTAITFVLTWIIDRHVFPIRFIFLGGAMLVALGIGIMGLTWRRYGKVPVPAEE